MSRITWIILFSLLFQPIKISNVAPAKIISHELLNAQDLSSFYDNIISELRRSDRLSYERRFFFLFRQK